jgi:hypothetical protein
MATKQRTTRCAQNRANGFISAPGDDITRKTATYGTNDNSCRTVIALTIIAPIIAAPYTIIGINALGLAMFFMCENRRCGRWNDQRKRARHKDEFFHNMPFFQSTIGIAMLCERLFIDVVA